jgi:hypothetical protein
MIQPCPDTSILKQLKVRCLGLWAEQSSLALQHDNDLIIVKSGMAAARCETDFEDIWRRTDNLALRLWSTITFKML